MDGARLSKSKQLLAPSTHSSYRRLDRQKPHVYTCTDTFKSRIVFCVLAFHAATNGVLGNFLKDEIFPKVLQKKISDKTVDCWACKTEILPNMDDGAA